MLETRESGVPLKRQAVLFRSSHHSDVLELELTRRNIPFVKYGGLKFLEAAHVKDLLAVLRWADNPKNRIAAFRALQLLPGMGPATAEQSSARFERSGWSWNALPEFSAPAALAEAWDPFAELMVGLAVTEGPWQGQVGARRANGSSPTSSASTIRRTCDWATSCNSSASRSSSRRGINFSPSWRSIRRRPPAISRARRISTRTS